MSSIDQLTALNSARFPVPVYFFLDQPSLNELHSRRHLVSSIMEICRSRFGCLPCRRNHVKCDGILLLLPPRSSRPIWCWRKPQRSVLPVDAVKREKGDVIIASSWSGPMILLPHAKDRNHVTQDTLQGLYYQEIRATNIFLTQLLPILCSICLLRARSQAQLLHLSPLRLCFCSHYT